ncbi:hypothetical protein [Vreelandella sulfidaeris]|uniref:hypothetical protein n=1 Tax=Vreelandella sulfidaeris TaxID=115553 RepID=UPI0035ECE0DA
MVDQFATIVGLLSAFSSGRNAKKALDLAEFQVWLSEHNHEDVIELINFDANINLFVKAYLNKQIPEIQNKLDTIIELVIFLGHNNQSGEIEFSGKSYLKGVLLLGLERLINSGLGTEDFDIAHSYIVDVIGDNSRYNEYVLEKMVHVCLQKKNTASHVFYTYWPDLVEF